MMMANDLISRSALIKSLKANTMSNGTLINTNTMLAVIEKFPTAYDVEKVVEELEKEKFLIPPENEGHYADNALILEDAIRIVRKGGVE